MRHVTSAQRVAARFQRRGHNRFVDADFQKAVDDALDVHRRYQALVAKFPGVLRQALKEAEGLPEGWVWQQRFVKYWEPLDQMERELQAADEVFDWLYITSKKLQDQANISREATYAPPRKARVEHAFDVIEFFKRDDGRDYIAYSVAQLQEWAEAFEKWSKASTRQLQTQAKKARRKLRRK